MQRRKYVLLLVLFVALSMCVSSCASWQKQQNLFDDIGGKQQIARIFGIAVQKIYADPILFKHFDGVPKKHIHQMLSKQTCELIGGPCKYDGKSMRESHTGMNITEEEFYLLVEHVQEAMREEGLTYQQENLIIKHLAPMKKDIVGI